MFVIVIVIVIVMRSNSICNSRLAVKEEIKGRDKKTRKEGKILDKG